MNELQHAQFVQAIPPAAILDNASATASEIDATGAGYVTIVLNLGATDIALTALKVQAASSSGGSFSDISGATFDGGTDIDGGTLALPIATDDNQVCVFQINMAGKDPYLKVVATFGDGTAGGYIAGVAIISQNAGPLLDDTDYADGGVCRVA